MIPQSEGETVDRCQGSLDHQMTASIIINEKHAEDFTSVAWVKFGAWVDSLPVPALELIVQLWEHGWTEPVAKQGAELTAAESVHPTKDRTAAKIAKDLGRLLADPKFDDGSEGVVVIDGANE